MIRKSARLLAAWGPVLAWMLLIFAVSAVPDVPDRPGLPRARNRRVDNGLREVAHAAEYAILAGLVWRATGGERRPLPALATSAGFSLIFAASDEFHQYFVPGRTCSLADWLIDLCGVILTLLLLLAYGVWRRRAAKPTAADR